MAAPGGSQVHTKKMVVGGGVGRGASLCRIDINNYMKHAEWKFLHIFRPAFIFT